MEFFPVGILIIFAVIVCAAIFLLTSIFGPKVPGEVKNSPYECGVKPEGNARHPFKTGFYLIAVLFLLFDVEAAFFFPWALIYRDSIPAGPDLLVAMLIYLFFMVIGLVYMFRKNVLRLR